ncbi:MAG: hypothetical protein AAF581_06030 [Planctomycetota bacterium]
MSTLRFDLLLIVAWLSVASGCSHTPRAAESPAALPHPQLHAEAVALAAFVESPLAKEFLIAVGGLPVPEPRVLYRDKKRSFLTPAAVATLAAEELAALEKITIEGERFYTTKYGTPLAYSRVLDIAAAYGFGDPANKRVLDFGYGSIGQLRLLATLGVHAVGVDVDSLLVALYSQPIDQGAIANANGPDGSVTLVHGQWPAEKQAVAEVGQGYDLISSKNTLKRGYIHPGHQVDPRLLVHLGVNDAAYLKALYGALNPGGLVVIYNICPAQNPEKYIPWADGRCPFSREDIEHAGFETLEYDANDDRNTREMARRLGWDEGPGAMDLATDLFGTYTVLRRPR